MKYSSFLVVFGIFIASVQVHAAAQKHKYGEPRQLFKFNGEGTNFDVDFDNEFLEKVLMDEKVRSRKIVFLNIASAYKQEKNFLLDYCLRYLYANYKSISNLYLKPSKNWLGDKNDPTIGFSSAADNAMGIKLWSDVFLHETNEGQEIAILVMETKAFYKGLFEDELSSQINAKIFTLGFLISSVQVFNILEEIEDEQIKLFKSTVKYAKYAAKEMEDENQKSLQKFLFLIRFWKTPEKHQFGHDGGQKYLESILEFDEEDNLKKTKKAIKASFEKLDCFLLPSPGRKVATIASFDGSWDTIDKSYLTILEQLIPSLLAPENLIVKEFNGREVQGYELIRTIVGLATIFTSNPEIPTSKEIYETTFDHNMFVLVDKVMISYEKNLISRGPSTRSNEDFVKLHEELKKTALRIMFEARNFFDKNELDGYINMLIWKIDFMYGEWCSSQRKSCIKVSEDDGIEAEKVVQEDKTEKEDVVKEEVPKDETKKENSLKEKDAKKEKNDKKDKKATSDEKCEKKKNTKEQNGKQKEKTCGSKKETVEKVEL